MQSYSLSAFSIQITWLLLAVCLTFFILTFMKLSERARGKKKEKHCCDVLLSVKWFDEASQKGCDLSLNHDIIHCPCCHTFPNIHTNTQYTQKICSKLIRYGNLYCRLMHAFLWMQKKASISITRLMAFIYYILFLFEFNGIPSE